MERVNQSVGYRLLEHTNTRFANINNAKPVWWFDIPPEMFDQDLHLLLAGNPMRHQRGGVQGLIWLKVKAGTFPDPGTRFYPRRDNGKIQLNISSGTGPEYLCDTTGTHYDFRPHVEKEWP